LGKVGVEGPTVNSQSNLERMFLENVMGSRVL